MNNFGENRSGTMVNDCSNRLGGWPRHRGAMGLLWTVVLGMLVWPGSADAARIGDLVETEWVEQVARFFRFQDPSVRYAVVGSLLLGLSCGVMGCFLVVRRLALMSDALSHAVLPGVAIGFLWSMSKDPVAIFIGAVVAGSLGAAVTQAIQQTTRQKEDAALGFVLAAFYAVGICLMTMIQRHPAGDKSGLDGFLFGQAAALGTGEVGLLGGVTVLVIAVMTLFYKEMLVTSFDPGFARGTGLAVPFYHGLLMVLLAFAIVAALQAVGVILVAAMLVIPAAAAYLLTDRFGWMLVLGAVFGMATGLAGTFFSFVGRNLPTGPLMVIAAAAVFLLAMVFGPRHGILAKWWRHRTQRLQIGRENTLKALYRALEDGGFERRSVSVRELAERRRESPEEAEHQLRQLRQKGMISVDPDGGAATFTEAGWRRAGEIVRNHRLWELYLTEAVDYAADHVHEDAERIEHVLAEETVRKLEKRLGYAAADPHGRRIPSQNEIAAGAPPGGGVAGGGRREREEGQ